MRLTKCQGIKVCTASFEECHSRFKAAARSSEWAFMDVNYILKRLSVQEVKNI